MEMKQMVN